MGKPWDKKISRIFCAVSATALLQACGPVEESYVPMGPLTAVDIKIFAEYQGRSFHGVDNFSTKDISWYTAVGDSIARAENPYVLSDSTRIWHQGRALHREKGPAVIYPNQLQEFFLMGEKYDPAQEAREALEEKKKARRVGKSVSEKKYKEVFLQGRARDVHTQVQEGAMGEYDIRRYAADQVHFHGGNSPMMTLEEYTWMYNMEKKIQTAHSPMTLKDGTQVWHHDRFLSRVVYADGSEEKFKFGQRLSATDQIKDYPVPTVDFPSPSAKANPR